VRVIEPSERTGDKNMGFFNRNNKKEQEAQRLREQRTVLARVFSDENKEIEFIKR
jgi:hypothetical protein